MKQVNKRLYIITTRSINKNGFLNENDCEKKTVNADSPVMQFLIGDIDEALVSWIYALLEKQDSDTLPQVLNLLGINDLSLFEDQYYLMDIMNEDYKRDILHKFSIMFTEYERSNLKSPVEDFCSSSYLEIVSGDVRIVALPHLAPERNTSIEDNRCWTNALINTFAEEGEEIRLILHDKDIYGYENMEMGLQDDDNTRAICGRDDVYLFLFKHNEKEIDKSLSIANYQDGINEIERIFYEEETEQALNRMMR